MLCSKFFGVYLNVTSLRAINNTAVKNAAAHGDLNDTQLDEYNIECQGHTTRMGKKAYNHSVEPDRAKTLQQINDSINKKYGQNFYSSRDEVSSSDGGDGDSDGDSNEEDISNVAQICVRKKKRDESYVSMEDNIIINKKKKFSGDEELKNNHDDWGKKHPFYGKESRKIKWSPFEKDYLQAIYDKHRHNHNVWRHCLDCVLNTNDENVRQQFHMSHLTVVKFKDAIRVGRKKGND